MGISLATDRPTAPPFPFVVGCARSGTSLLRAMLDSHPNLAMPTESHFIPKLIGPPSALAESLRTDQNFRNWGIRVPVLAGARDYSDAIRKVYQAYAASHHKSRYGDKTPAYVLHIPLLARLFPGSLFIHMIRDGRDTALSLLETPFGPKTLQDAALRWRRYVAARRIAGRRLPDRYVEVGYERLVEDPQSILIELCDRLKISYSPAMLEYPRRIQTLRPRASAQDHLRHGPAQTRDWRVLMSRDEVRVFERLAGDLLAPRWAMNDPCGAALARASSR